MYANRGKDNFIFGDMEEYRQLNFPAVHLRCERRAEGLSVWDTLRRRFVVLTPEEWVRRHVVEWLMGSYGVGPTQIVLEYPVEVGGQHQRADVVVVDREGHPRLVVECKAASIDFTRQEVLREVYAQALRYNAVLHAPQLMITNGLRHFCFHTDDFSTYVPISSLQL